jgi:ABC-type amino acid transport substrate-binding protein
VSTAIAENDLMSKVSESNTLVVANTQGHAPWDFLDENNQLTGLGIELVREVAKRMKIENVEFVSARFADLIPGIQSGRFDLVVAGHSITEERLKIVDFSNPYMAVGTSIFVRKGDNRFRSFEHIAGHKIGVLAGSIQEKFLAEEHGDKNVSVRTYENPTQALSDLSFGRIDGVIYSDDAGSFIAQVKNLEVVRGVQVNQEINAMVYRKGEEAFGSALNAALDSIFSDGTYSELSAKWLGDIDMAKEVRKRSGD